MLGVTKQYVDKIAKSGLAKLRINPSIIRAELIIDEFKGHESVVARGQGQGPAEVEDPGAFNQDGDFHGHQSRAVGRP